MTVTTVAHGIGKGLVAGLVGTVAMTVSSTIEQKARGRPASSAPAHAAEKALGIEKFQSGAAEQRFSTLVHWGYGTGWGVVRGLLRAAGLPPKVATAIHGPALWGSEQVMLPVLDVAPPVTIHRGRRPDRYGAGQARPGHRRGPGRRRAAVGPAVPPSRADHPAWQRPAASSQRGGGGRADHRDDDLTSELSRGLWLSGSAPAPL